MDMKRLRDLRLAWPFKPFYLLTTDGKRYLVEHPYHLGIAPDLSKVGVIEDDRKFHQLKPEQVLGVDFALEQRAADAK